MRKVSELTPSADKPKPIERNQLLEQIRNKVGKKKSFLLLCKQITTETATHFPGQIQAFILLEKKQEKSFLNLHLFSPLPPLLLEVTLKHNCKHSIPSFLLLKIQHCLFSTGEVFTTGRKCFTCLKLTILMGIFDTKIYN